MVKRTSANQAFKMLDLSRIDTTEFKAHSLLSSFTSKVANEANEGIKLRDILFIESWSSESIWQKFYPKKGKSLRVEFQKLSF